MKQKSIFSIFGIVLIVFVLIAMKMPTNQNDKLQKSKVTSNKTIETNYKKYLEKIKNRKYAIINQSTSSYIDDGDPISMYKNSDLVVVAKIIDVKKSEIGIDGSTAIYTNYIIEVVEKIDGIEKGKILEISAPDGEVTLERFLEVNPDIKTKDGFKMPTKYQLKNMYVKQISEDNAKLNIGETRLFFLDFDKIDNIYSLKHNSEGALVPAQLKNKDFINMKYKNIENKKEYVGKNFILK